MPQTPFINFMIASMNGDNEKDFYVGSPPSPKKININKYWFNYLLIYYPCISYLFIDLHIYITKIKSNPIHFPVHRLYSLAQTCPCLQSRTEIGSCRMPTSTHARKLHGFLPQTSVRPLSTYRIIIVILNYPKKNSLVLVFVI